MPLDPQAQTLLDQLAALGGPKLNTLTPPEAREVYRVFASLAPVPEVTRVVDETVGDVPVRVFYPFGSEHANAPLPVVVWFHGGGWVVGDLSTSDATAADLANSSGCVVVNVDYRLAPEHAFPGPLEDCFAAVQWVASSAGVLGVDPARLAVGGDSAGGNLAAALCLLARDRGGPSIRFQLLVYPALDGRSSYPSIRDNASGYLLESETMAWFWAQYIGDADPETPLVSPIYAEDLSGLPAALIITAEFDPLRDEAEAYGELLSQADVITTTSRYDGQIHGFFSMPGILDSGRKAVDEAAQALRAAL